MTKTLAIQDLGRMGYRQAWEIQERVHESVLGGGEEKILLVEHPPVITLGRRGETAGNLKTDRAELERLGVELVHSDRGGDITYHGPGQIVAYPIIRLAAHGFSVGGYVHRLESVVIAALKEMGIEGFADPEAVGVWVEKSQNAQHSTLNTQHSEENNGAAKICAIGVRVKRGVSMHGLALNVLNDMSGFSHIVPCGLAGWGVTSVHGVLGNSAPLMEQVKDILVRQLVSGLEAR